MARPDGRRADQLRPVTIHRGFVSNEPASVLIEVGRTRVLCVATVEESVPPFLRNSGSGWVTAEYGMLPRSSPSRIPRESIRGRVKGRTHEIQRLIGRSLRASVDLKAIGERQVVVDCDVIEADGGTRTASITGGCVALMIALEERGFGEAALGLVAAVSVGVVGGRVLLDLPYEEDAAAEVDMNVVMDDRGRFIEVQGTAEGEPYDRATLDRLLESADRGVRRLVRAQRKVLCRK